MILIVFAFSILIQTSLPKVIIPTDFSDHVSNLPNYTSGVPPTSYAGFAPLDDQNISALFYWFFPANGHYSSDVPMLLWLEGGPASASFNGLFVENGPFNIKQNSDGGLSIFSRDQPGKLQSWAAFYNVIYLDSPVGTGYSYTANNTYSTTEDEIGNNVWKALQYFLSVHPETIDAKWYFTGESYAGRFVPASAYWTLQNNDKIKAGQMQGTIINLQGVLVGSGFVLAVSQRLTSMDASQAANLLTPNEYKQTKTIAAECQQLSGMGENYTVQAVSRCNDLLGYYNSVSGISAVTLSLPDTALANFGGWINTYFNDPEVIKSMHAENSKKQGTIYDGYSSLGAQALNDDFLGNSLNYINFLLTRVPCLFYEGNLDGQDGSYGTYDWFQYLEGSYPNILNTTRNIWYVNGFSVGMYTQYQNMTYIIVDFAGHFVPYFELNVTVKMIEIFTLLNSDWTHYSGFTPTPVNQLMCHYTNNCNGNGYCTNLGTCVCLQGYGLADCSVQATAINTQKTYTVNQRGYLFFEVPLNGNDMIVEFLHEGGVLGVYYTPFAPGPVADDEDAEASLLPIDSNPSKRSLYLNSYGKNVGYLTIQNSQYFNPISFQISLVSTVQMTTEILVKENESIIFGLNTRGVSVCLYLVCFLMLVTVGVIIRGSRKKEEPLTFFEKENLNSEISQTLVA